MAAGFYWVGGSSGHTNEWNWAGNWSSSSGGAGGVGIPGAGDDVFFTSGSSVNCSLNVSPTINSLTANPSYYTGTLSLGSYNLTINNNFGWGGSSNTLNAGSGTITVSGNFQLTGGNFIAGSSTLILNGSGKFISASAKTFYNLQISNNIFVNAPTATSISNNLTIDSGRTLFLNTYAKLRMLDGSSLTNSGVIGGVDGIIDFYDSAIVNVSGSGSITAPQRVTANTANTIIPARTYLGRFEIANNGATNRVATLASGNIAFDDLHIMPYSSGNMQATGLTNNPNVAVHGYLDLGTPSSGTPSIILGLGTWTISPYVNLDQAGVTKGSANIVLDGSTAARWSGLGHAQNIIYSSVSFNGDFYVGGDFTAMSGVAANHIAKWNGSSWSAVGDGFNDGVSSFAVYNGELYAGGYFTHSGSTAINYLAKWSGSAWVPVGSNDFDSSVNSLYVYNTNLIVGGWFGEYGGSWGSSITSWNGTTFSPLGAGFDASVSAMTTFNGDLIAVGRFSVYGGSPSLGNYIAKWNGSSWSPLGSGLDDDANSVVVYNGNLIVGGYFTHAGGLTSYAVAQWNGSSWSNGMSLGAGAFGTANYYVRSLAVYNGDLLAGGDFATNYYGNVSAPFDYLVKWNGSGWTEEVPGSHVDFPVLTMTVDGNNLIAGGQTFGGQSYGYSELLIFAPVQASVTHSVTIVKTGTGDGTFDQSSPQTVDDGSGFTVTATPNTNSNFTSWAGCDSVNGTICNLVDITEDKVVTATFTLADVSPATKEQGVSKLFGVLPITGPSIFLPLALAATMALFVPALVNYFKRRKQRQYQSS